MTELIQNLGIDWKILIAQIVNFAILLVLLKKFAYGPILKALNDRRATIEEAIERSRHVDQKVKEVEALKKEVLDKARQESEEILKKAGVAAARVQEEVLGQTHEKSEHMLMEAQKKIEAEREKIFADVKREIAVLITGAIEKSVGDIMDDRAQEQLVQQAVRVLTSNTSR